MLRRVDVDDGNEPCDDASYGLGGCIERIMVNMSVAAVTKANDLRQPVIVTDRTASKNQCGDAQHFADMFCWTPLT